MGGLFFWDRFPRVRFKTEMPFLYGAFITLGIITYFHHKAYSKWDEPGRISFALLRYRPVLLGQGELREENKNWVLLRKKLSFVRGNAIR